MKKLLAQKRAVLARQEELKRIERKIDNRLQMVTDARSSIFDTVQLAHKSKCRMVWVSDCLKNRGFLDMEVSF